MVSLATLNRLKSCLSAVWLGPALPYGTKQLINYLVRCGLHSVVSSQ